jgi:hypothetical protein
MWRALRGYIENSKHTAETGHMQKTTLTDRQTDRQNHLI